MPLKSLSWKIKYPSLKLPMLTETHNLNLNYKKTEISRIDTKARLKISSLKTTL